MPKRKIQTQNSPRSTQSQKCRRDQDASSTDSSSDIFKDPPTNPLNDSTTDPPAQLSKNHDTGPSMNSSEEPGTESFAKTSKGLSTDLSKLPSQDASTDPFEGSSTNPSQDLSKDHIKDQSFDIIQKPFGETAGDDYFSDPKGVSITATNISSFREGSIVEFKVNTYPFAEDLQNLARRYTVLVTKFAGEMTNPSKEITLVADETDRVQQIFDEFGQQDPSLPPTMVAERLKDAQTRSCTVEYIIQWALLTNTAVDGDIEYTLLPRRILALYRDLDRDSSDMHRILFNRWVALTFGLLAGGYREYQASAEAGQRIDRIRRFIHQLMRPYCVENDFNGNNFSKKVDEILQFALAIGYHLMAMPEKYRWDWTWLAPKSKLLGRLQVGTPPPRRPAEEVIPKGMWVTCPALVKETNDLGQQLAEEITLVPAVQSWVVPQLEYGKIDDAAWEKVKADVKNESRY